MRMSVSTTTAPAVPERVPATKLLMNCTSAGLAAGRGPGTAPAGALATAVRGSADAGGAPARWSRCSYSAICGAMNLMTRFIVLTARVGSRWLSTEPATSMAMATSGPSPSSEP